MSSDRRNLLLAALPEGESARLGHHLERVQLRQGQVVQQSEGLIRWVYFPEDAILTVVIPMSGGTTIEAGMIGNRGAAEVGVVLGAHSAPHQVQVLIEGASLRMRADVLRRELSLGPSLQRLLLRYALHQLVVLRQLLACNSLHPVEGRVARFLLQLRDRTRYDEFRLTQELIACMLGVRRAGVSEVVNALSAAGVIEKGRGWVRVLDRGGLEGASCECYGIIRHEWERLLSELGGPPPRALSSAPSPMQSTHL